MGKAHISQVPPGSLEAMTVMFCQADLSLAIANEKLSKHGGKLGCNSVLGKGTEFIMETPV
jgi:hypothetical protein